MSDEEEGLIEKTFIAGLGAKYAFVKAGDAPYDIKFFPSVYCIDANGTVFSVPDDRMPDEATIEELLKSVSLVPKLPDGAQFDPLRQMWKKAEHGKLRDYLDKLLQQPNLEGSLREVYQGQRDELTKRSEAQLARIERLGQGPDYAAAETSLEKIDKQWKGFPAAEAAQKQLARFTSDVKIKKELGAGKALTKLQASLDPSKSSQRKKLVEALPGFIKKYEGTEAAKQAQEQLTRLRAARD